MEKEFKPGDKVRWNYERGTVEGTVIKIHVSDFDFKGYTHHANPGDPQYEVKSDKTGHVAAHKGSALTKIK